MIEYPAKLDNLPFFVDMAAAAAREAGLSDVEVGRVELCVEEVIVNIINYAYHDGVGAVRMECSKEEEKFVVAIRDDGIPFDMTLRPDPDISSEAEDREVGGLGIFMVKQLMDRVEYERRDGQNILALWKNIPKKNQTALEKPIESSHDKVERD